MNSEITDSIFIKIKNENLNKIHDWVFKYMLINTTCSEEVIFIKRKLQYSKIKFSKQMLLDYIDFSEDFQENYNILLELHTKYKRQVPSFKYTYVLETAETHDEIEAILNLMKTHEIGFSVITLIALLEKQKTYNEARKILNEKILIDDSNKKRLYGKSYDRIHDIFAILYLKATEVDELNEIKNDLLSVEMSTVIDDYSYYNMKASKRRTNSFRTAYSKEENNAIFVDAVNQFLWNEINNDLISSNRFEYDSLPKKVQMNCNTYIRDKSKSDDIKSLYKYCCQICGKPLDIGNSLYSEVHHLHPLYLGGPDTQDNMINLCPNHHTLFDRGAITIDIENMKVFHVNKTIEDLILLKHSIRKASILYHNQNIFNKKQTFSFDLNKKESIINYGCKVLLINILTKEEKVIFIESNEFDINFSTYLLLNYRRGDHVLYNGVTYIIKKID